ncbi:N-formylglutamate deformylase [Luteibacter sp. UNCMF366Tsu5.1]|uniref:N-formylglutamate deformylase n=1 Tax=Luteibacter sp. UNCMF366Tsu5.1 TaxID=1502758 RepID=UPI000908BE8A|nr:N-formylglutamate deformylase [Luteibacter sp. UNCMF366Tsu5.1]SFW33784.1 N-formylglutamate deformylase [Luteibacter sp. UNCMF366Tsu5.1]
MSPYTLHRGTAPLLISLPHNGSAIPDDLAARMKRPARRSPDTDWHVAELYDFARGLGASVIKPFASRYVVDLNRPADGHALYPGQSETGLVPTVQFSGEPIYRGGAEPDAEDIGDRVKRWWKPYHRALADELGRLRKEFGRVVLWEGHSIRSHVPMLFEGRLPDLNLGTADGASCSPGLQAALAAVLESQDDYSFAVNGRFKGGYITRHYGRPDQGVDAVQLELAQLNYMDEESFEYLPKKAANVQVLIGEMLKHCLDHARAG